MNQTPEPLVPCETWEIHIPTHPPHSKLYALEPCGIGTTHVESLTSYVTRLAEAHGVSLYNLVSQELLPLLKRDYLSHHFKNTLGAFWKEAARAVNGTGILARDWARSLECLTLRSDLSILTLLPWAAVLTQQRLLRLTRVWCSECFREWKAAGQTIYEPLIWNVNVVSVCVHHQRPLLGQCPYPDCQTVLPLLASQASPGFCSKCARWLGISMDPKTSWTTEQWDWHIWVANITGNLLAHNHSSMPTPHLRNIPDLIAAHQKETAGSLQTLAENLQLARKTLDVWKLGVQVPQMESLMRLCYCCGVSLYDLFTAQQEISTCIQLKPRSLPQLSNSPKRQRRRLDIPHIQLTLESTLANEELPPPSMRSMAKRLEHSPKELREHFPELSRAISNRYKNYGRVRHERKLEQTKERVRQAILKIHSQGFYPNPDKIATFLNEPSVMRDPLIRKFWREMLREMKLTD